MDIGRFSSTLVIILAAALLAPPETERAESTRSAVSALGSGRSVELTGATSAAVAAERSKLRVASVNAREGSLKRRPVDMRDPDDRRALVRRVLAGGADVPDVVLLQEVLGSAGLVSRALNRHPRALRAGARYRVAVAPGRRPGDGRCDGRRTRRHEILRDGAILVNRRTVRDIRATGRLRTWGAWSPGRGWRYGCAEHGWALLRVRAGGAARSVRVANLHLAPKGVTMKNRALRSVVNAMKQLNRRTPRAVMVIGGDFNAGRCRGDVNRPERLGCAVRNGHRRLLDNGFHDANRAGRNAARDVIGVKRRIDFLYTDGPVNKAWYARCYRAFDVAYRECSARRSVFESKKRFHSCQFRMENYGYAGGSCSRAKYRRYYSDHPILRTSVG